MFESGQPRSAFERMHSRQPDQRSLVLHLSTAHTTPLWENVRVTNPRTNSFSDSAHRELQSVQANVWCAVMIFSSLVSESVSRGNKVLEECLVVCCIVCCKVLFQRDNFRFAHLRIPNEALHNVDVNYQHHCFLRRLEHCHVGPTKRLPHIRSVSISSPSWKALHKFVADRECFPHLGAFSP